MASSAKPQRGRLKILFQTASLRFWRKLIPFDGGKRIAGLFQFVDGEIEVFGGVFEGESGWKFAVGPQGFFGLEHGRIHGGTADGFDDGVGINAELLRHQHGFAVCLAEDAQE